MQITGLNYTANLILSQVAHHVHINGYLRTRGLQWEKQTFARSMQKMMITAMSAAVISLPTM